MGVQGILHNHSYRRVVARRSTKAHPLSKKILWEVSPLGMPQSGGRIRQRFARWHTCGAMLVLRPEANSALYERRGRVALISQRRKVSSLLPITSRLGVVRKFLMFAKSRIEIRWHGGGLMRLLVLGVWDPRSVIRMMSEWVSPFGILCARAERFYTKCWHDNSWPTFVVWSKKC